MPNYNLLKAEVLNDPLGRGYSTKTNQQVSDDLNTAYRTKVTPQIPIRTVSVWAANNGVRANIEKAALNNTSPVQAPCLALIDLFQGLTGPALDLSIPENQTMMVDLIANNVMTADQATALQALTAFPLQRSVEVWGIITTAVDIYVVRGGS